jgi:hypothetical protein
MSEQASTIQIIAYIAGMIPSVYFAYRLLVEVYHYLTKKEDDFL